MTWEDDAACQGQPTSLFFPDNVNAYRAAQAICQSCPVIAECREAGKHEEYGVWAGQSAYERFGVKPKAKPKVCRECGDVFFGVARRPTCDTCRVRIRRETWRLSAQRTRAS